MDVLAMDEDFLELSSGDMRDMWDTSSLLETSLTEGDGEWACYEDRSSSVILRDRMITEASLPIKSEHSYCNDVTEMRLPAVKLEDDMESECYPAISMSTATSGGGDSGDLVTRADAAGGPVPADAAGAIGVSVSSSGVIQDSMVGSVGSAGGGISSASVAVTSVSSIGNVGSISGGIGNGDIISGSVSSGGVSSGGIISGSVSSGIISSVGGAAERVAVGPVAAQPAGRRLVLTQQSREELQLLRADRSASQPAHIKISAGQSVLRPQTIVLTSRPSLVQRPADSGAVPRLSVKLEPNTAFVLPPTPPSSVDSDGGSSPPYLGSRVSPVRTLLQRPPKVLVTTGRPPVRHISASLISTTPRGAHGTLYLTEEEKRTLVSEGYAIPNRLPLSKAEERSLKKIRRKIKNKISAQESRRKKKEYMDQMERRLDQMAADNEEYRQRLDVLETQRDQLSASNAELEQRNSQLSGQLEQLRQLLGADCPQTQDELPIIQNSK